MCTLHIINEVRAQRVLMVEVIRDRFFWFHLRSICIHLATIRNMGGLLESKAICQIGIAAFVNTVAGIVPLSSVKLQSVRFTQWVAKWHPISVHQAVPSYLIGLDQTIPQHRWGCLSRCAIAWTSRAYNQCNRVYTYKKLSLYQSNKAHYTYFHPITISREISLSIPIFFRLHL